MNRRQALEALRAGPALVTDFPGDAVDIDGLLAHLIGRGFEGGIYLADLEMESLVWVNDGEAQDAWFFDVDGGEAVLAGAGGHDLFREMASHGSTLSVYVGAPPDVAFGQAAGPPSAAPATVFKVPGQSLVTSSAIPAVEPAEVSGVAAGAPPPPMIVKPVASPPKEAVPVAPVREAPPAPARETPPARPREASVAPVPVLQAGEPVAPVEASTRAWPRIMEGVAERVARHRGQRLAQRFTSTLAAALAPHGGRVDGSRVYAPPISEAAWRVIVETTCESIIAVAGRAFVDRTIAAAERDAAGAGDSGAVR